MTIENGEGFSKWLENQKIFLKSLEQNEFDEKMKNRIELLRKWATKKKLFRT